MIGFITNITKAIYSGASPTTVALGGLPINSDIAGNTLSQVLEKIVSAFVNPIFITFLMSGQATTVESGTTLSGTKTFPFSFSLLANVLPNTVQIIDAITNTVLASNLSTTASAVVSIGSVVINGNGIVYNWFAKATNTKNVLFSSTFFAVTSRYSQFYGNGSASPTTSSQVRALSNSNFANVNSFSIVISSTKFSVAIPASKSLVSVITANNENITAQFILSTFTVNDAGGTAIAYKIYNFSSASPLNTNVTITVA